jgi:hypothetical protein
VASILLDYLLDDNIGHLSLWKLGIYCRDINLQNLASRTVNGNTSGMIIDLDLAIRKEDTTVSHKCRIGTLPFMALDLAREWGFEFQARHVYRYDAESFLWVLVWIITQFENGECERLLHHKWQQGTEQSGNDRLYLLLNGYRKKLAVTPSFKLLRTSALRSLMGTYVRINMFGKEDCESSSQEDDDDNDDLSSTVEGPDDYIDEIVTKWEQLNQRLTSIKAT